MWSFERIPEDRVPEVLRAWKNQEFRALMDIYNLYGVSPDVLWPCCCGEAITLWTGWAIREGKLK